MASDLQTKQITVYVNELASIAAGLKLAEEMLTKIRNGGSYDALEYISSLETIRNASDLAKQYASEVAHTATAENGYDYRNQAWVVDGKYVACNHPASMKCDCFGTVHAGEPIKANADVH